MIKWLISGIVVIGLFVYVISHADDNTPIWEDHEQQKYLQEWAEKKRRKKGRFYEREKRKR